MYTCSKCGEYGFKEILNSDKNFCPKCEKEIDKYLVIAPAMIGIGYKDFGSEKEARDYIKDLVRDGVPGERIKFAKEIPVKIKVEIE